VTSPEVPSAIGADAATAILDLLADTARRLGEQPDELTRVDGLHWLFEYAAAMVEYYTHADPHNPRLMPMVTPFRRFLGDLQLAKHCYVARLSADCTYRLRCEPGDAAFISITVHADEAGGIAGNRALGKLNDRELQREPDGSFSVVIGPAPEGPNTIRIDRSVGSLMTREFFDTDESVRREARWSIDVVAGAPPPRLSRGTAEAALATGLASALANLRDALPRYPRPVDAPVFGKGAATNEFEPFFAFLPDAVTTWGNLDALHTTMAYDVDADHAIVIDGGPPIVCAWWGITLSNRFLSSFPRGPRTALAGRAVALEPDGAWRVVVAERDPGHPNWLATCGRNNGVLRIRWLIADTRPQLPVARVVPLHEL
jgi:hypothetical protein